MLNIERYSIGAGDRFGREGAAQLAAFAKAREAGVEAAIVWNKSRREHELIGSTPADQKAAALAAVAAAAWKGPWHVDADHVGLATVEAFAPHCDYFTLDVADFIGKEAPTERIEAFVARQRPLLGRRDLPAEIDAAGLRKAASLYLVAVEEAAKTYRRVVELRGGDDFITEVSLDETDKPQSPAELLVILAALAEEGVPVQTLAPRFPGRFNKGVDYVGRVEDFLRDFLADIRVLEWAKEALGLPAGLKLSVHTGSDKFSLYRGMGDIIRREGVGLHLKTAGTTWLEEIVGLAEAGGEGLAVAREVYRASYEAFDLVVAPYAAVIDIDRARLPSPAVVEGWSGTELAAALRHVPGEGRYNPHMRQLVHVGFRVAAAMGDRYLEALERHREVVSRNVTENLWERHLRPLLVG